VAYVLRETIGWLDKNGNSIKQNIAVSYADLVNKAGVSRGAARKVIDEAVAGGFIRCTDVGHASERGVAGHPASFSLCWDAGDVAIAQYWWTPEGENQSASCWA
jgi:hypothetical protein